uniref:Apple domain-containing protein n=1 Tax=Capitella teleta TaxID=283909 RepID=X2A7M1_CAPTE
MHLKVLVWILICATEALQYSSDVFNANKDVGLGFDYSAISSVTVDSQVACALICSTNPCCLSGFWKRQSDIDNCRLYDAQFLPEFLTKEDKTVYFTRREAHPRRNELSSWAIQKDRVIRNYDEEKLSVCSLQECQKHCDHKVWCISFDVTVAGCYLSAVGEDMVDRWAELPGTSHGARVCNAQH